MMYRYGIYDSDVAMDKHELMHPYFHVSEHCTSWQLLPGDASCQIVNCHWHSLFGCCAAYLPNSMVSAK